MTQYQDLITTILEKGVDKPAARAGMPGSRSRFGHQMRFDLTKGFPLQTTKKMFTKGIIVELLWFLRGDTNIKFLVDNGCNIWNQDAYNYYKIKFPDSKLTFENFVESVKTGNLVFFQEPEDGYKLGDCGSQYGRTWRAFGEDIMDIKIPELNAEFVHEMKGIDQLVKVINQLNKTPESRRHVVTSIDPAHDEDLALYWCHALFQFNCRPLTLKERKKLYEKTGNKIMIDGVNLNQAYTRVYDLAKIPKYYLDCHLYQRSADTILGVPFNIASYSFLIHIIARITNMIPGDFIHSFGDVHIYDNHTDAVKEIMARIPRPSPTVQLNEYICKENYDTMGADKFFTNLQVEHFNFIGYDPFPAVKAELSTGLK